MKRVFLLFFRSRAALLTLALAVSAFGAQAQRPERIKHQDDYIWHQPYYRGPLRYGVSFGRTVYYGDLGGLSANTTRASYGLALSYTAFPNLDVAVEGQFIRLEAEDQNRARNYRFHTEMAELTLVGRQYIERYRFDPALDSRDVANLPRYRFFGTLGAGLAVWWPTRTGGPPDADALGHEQQYPAYSWLVPVGGGVSMRLSPRLWVLPELTYRFTFTDDLDDVGAKRGGGRNDGYLQLAFRFQYQLPPPKGKSLR